MPGSFDLNPVPSQIANQALPVIVCEYDPAGADNPYTILPNIRCLRIDYREGLEPPVARFAYMMDDLLDAALGWPSQFEELWPIDAQGQYVVQTDDRLAVLTQDPSGNPIVLFDGFAQIPQFDVNGAGGAQSVSFVAIGVSIRLWDTPISYRQQRNGGQGAVVDGTADRLVNLPTRFNPAQNSISARGGYIGNSVSAFNKSTDSDGNRYKVFIDPVVGERQPTKTDYWSVAEALAYLIETWPSPLDIGQHPFVVFPTLDSLQPIFQVPQPNAGGVLGPAGFISRDMQIRDLDATNKAAPDVISELLRYCGLVGVFVTGQDADGLPQTTMVIQRRDELATVAPKPIYLAAGGARSLNLASNNATGLHLARDCNAIVNQWTVETGLKQVECTIYLAPLFQPNSGDENDPQIKTWYSANLANATDASRRMYRWYGADECADGHWNATDLAWVTDTPCDFTPAFPDDKGTGKPTWVQRYRPGSRTIIASDASGKPLKAVLELCTSAASDDPQIKAGPDGRVWTVVTKGWQLLDDRLGIEVTVENPEKWDTGQQQGIGGNGAVITILGVSWLADPDVSKGKSVFLRLTTVIESDQQILAVTAPKRIASPTPFARERIADGKDHFQFCSILPDSFYYVASQLDDQGNPPDGTNRLVVRDDADAARTHAEQLRGAHEFPTLAGSIDIPFVTDYYAIGDLIKVVQGRGASLQTNVGVDQGETPTYPWCTAFSWDFQGNQQRTILQLSDRRAEPQGV